MPRFARFAAFLFAVGLALSSVPGLLATAAAQETAAPQVDGAAAQEADVANLTGFRSALFGTDEEAVRAAIKADFGVEDDMIQVGQNTVERTQVMTVSVPDILPEGGTAQISYIFGYKSKALIQVGLLWSAESDADITDAILAANADVLRAYFLNAGYLPDSITRDVALENGLLVFRGSDPAGHTAILLMQGTFEETEGQRMLLPKALTLVYAVSPDNPDILTITTGDF